MCQRFDVMEREWKNLQSQGPVMLFCSACCVPVTSLLSEEAGWRQVFFCLASTQLVKENVCHLECCFHRMSSERPLCCYDDIVHWLILVLLCLASSRCVSTVRTSRGARKQCRCSVKLCHSRGFMVGCPFVIAAGAYHVPVSLSPA